MTLGLCAMQAGLLERRRQLPTHTQRLEAAVEGKLTVEKLRSVLEAAQRDTLAGVAVDVGALAQKCALGIRHPWHLTPTACGVYYGSTPLCRRVKLHEAT